MNIKKLYYLHRRLTAIKAWYFLLPAIIFGLLAVHGLRSNYSKMVDLREAVYVADRQNGDVEGALTKLREHVYGHMNTNLSSGTHPIKPPIQLKDRYERLVAQEKDRLKAANQKAASDGERLCAEKFPAAGFNAPRVSCIQEYVATNSIKDSSVVPDNLYKFDFISPAWSPDLAGLSIVLSIIFFVLYVARLILERVMLKRLHQ